MVLVIDGQYGTGLNWPNYKDYFEEDKFSPTHGEYVFAHKTRKRMLVFIRKSLMPHYQSYRVTMDNCKNDKVEAKRILSPTLPSYVTFETLDFINKVKTTKPIPWINEFDDITSVKKEIQKKMLNELAELFLIKNKHFETVIDSFNKVMDSFSLEEQRKALGKINATKEITDAVEKLEGFKTELEETKTELEKAKTSNSKDKDKFEKKITSLTKKITELENETLSSSSSQFFIKDGQVKIGNPNYLGNNFINLGTGVNLGSGVAFNTGSLGSTVFGFNSRKCDSCGKLENDPLRINISAVSFLGSQFNTCPDCKRLLCGDCWPKYNSLSTVSTVFTIRQDNKCPRCVKEGK